MTARKTTTKKRTPAKKTAAPAPAPVKTPTKRRSVSARKAMQERILDLDALRAVRAQERGDAPAPKIKLGGEIYELPDELSADFTFSLGSLTAGDTTRLERAFVEIFGEYADEVIAKMKNDDLLEFIKGVPELYGSDSGE